MSRTREQSTVSKQSFAEEEEEHDTFATELAPLNDLVTSEREIDGATTAGVLHADHIQGTNDQANERWPIDVGVDVVGSCGHKVGEVVDIRDEYVVVEKGFFMPEDVFVPKTAIARVGEHSLKLNVSKDVATHCGWDEDPDDNV